MSWNLGLCPYLQLEVDSKDHRKGSNLNSLVKSLLRKGCGQTRKEFLCKISLAPAQMQLIHIATAELL